jgi:hypothetical protein
MNQYRCETCKKKCRVNFERIPYETIEKVGCASHSDFQSERGCHNTCGLTDAQCEEHTELLMKSRDVTDRDKYQCGDECKGECSGEINGSFDCPYTVQSDMIVIERVLDDLCDRLDGDAQVVDATMHTNRDYVVKMSDVEMHIKDIKKGLDFRKKVSR